MKNIKNKFNSLPSAVKVIIYSGISVTLAVLSADIVGESSFNWREYAIVPVTMLINLVAYLNLKEDEQSS